MYSPSHDFGMVMFGTKDTGNRLADQFEGEYQNVRTVRTLCKIDLDFFRDIDTFTAEQESVPKGDIVDSLIVAMDMLNEHCGTKKFRKRVFLITDGEKPTSINTAEMDSLVQQMQEKDVRLNVITLDFANDLEDEEDDEDEIELDETDLHGDPNIRSSKQASKDKQKAQADLETVVQTKNKEMLVNLTQRIKGAIFPANIAM